MYNLSLKRHKPRDLSPKDEEQPESPVPQTSRNLRRRWCSEKCFCNGVTFIITTFGMTMLMVVYLLGGAYMFKVIEAKHELDTLVRERQRHIEERDMFVDKTMVLYQRMASQGLTPADVKNDFRQMLIGYVHLVMENKWDGRVGDEDEITEEYLFWQLLPSFVFATTTVTTIGYGDIVPKTSLGRSLTIAYAIVGIPCALIWLSHIGNALSLIIKVIYYRCCLSNRKLGSELIGEHETLDKDEDEYSPDITNNSSVYDKTSDLPSTKEASKKCISSTTLETNKCTQRTVDSVSKKTEGHSSLDLDNIMSKSSSTSSVDRDGSKVIRFTPGPSIHTIKSDGSIVSSTNSSIEPDDFIDIPVYLTISLMVVYITIGGVMCSQWEEDWDFMDACYFCFITLSTIGYGDFVIGKSRTVPGSVLNAYQIAIIATYIIFGLAFVAMCIKLLQNKIKMVSMKIRIWFWTKFEHYNSARRTLKLNHLKHDFEKEQLSIERKKSHGRKKEKVEKEIILSMFPDLFNDRHPKHQTV